MEPKLLLELGISEESEAYSAIKGLKESALKRTKELEETKLLLAKAHQEVKEVKAAAFDQEKKSVLDPLFENQKITKADYDSYLGYSEAEFAVAKTFLSK